MISGWGLNLGLNIGTRQNKAATSAPAYAGPGDLQTFLAWGGLRAYSAATKGTNCVRIIRASDSAQQDFVTLSTGALDTASVATFLAATTGKVVTLYDQTGNGFDFTNATDGTRPGYTATGPGLTFVHATAQTLVSAGNMSQAQPYTLVFVAKRTGNFTGFSAIVGDISPVVLGFANEADKTFMYSGSNTPTAAATDNVAHAVQGIFNNASSSMTVDGTTTAGDLGSAATLANTIALGPWTAWAPTATTYEVGFLAGASSAPQLAALDSNMRTFWGL